MSPEQARGRAVDKRADIWAFGCVVYEMLSGVSPFAGETTTDALAAVVGRDPDWSRLPSDTPPALRTLLKSALEKDPKRRLRDIGDAQLGLQERAETVAVPSAGSTRTARVWQTIAVLALISAAALGIERLRLTGRDAIADRPRQLTRADVRQWIDDRTERQCRWAACRVRIGSRGRRESRHLGTADGRRRRGTPHRRRHRRANAGGFARRDADRISFRSRGGRDLHHARARRRCAAHCTGGRPPKFSPDGRSIVGTGPAAGSRRAACKILGAPMS